MKNLNHHLFFYGKSQIKDSLKFCRQYSRSINLIKRFTLDICQAIAHLKTFKLTLDKSDDKNKFIFNVNIFK